MDELKLTLQIPKSIISSSREITVRILLEEDGESNNDFVNAKIIAFNQDYLSDCTFSNWKKGVSHFLFYTLAIKDEKIISLIIDAIELAIETNNPKFIFSRLPKNNKNLIEQMYNRINTKEVSISIHETFGRKVTPQSLVEYIYFQIKDASS